MNTLRQDTLLSAGEPARTHSTRKAWAVVAMLVIFQIINFADKAVLGLVAGPVMSELRINPETFGLIGSSFFFLFAIAAIVVGLVAQRVPTSLLLLIMGLSWALLQFPMFLGGGVAALVISRILLGAAEGPATPISLQHAHGWFAPENRGLPSSWVAIGSTLGPILATPVLIAVISSPNFGWRWAFGLLGIVGLVWSAAWFFMRQDGPFSHTHSAKKRAAAKTPPDAVSATTAPQLGEAPAAPNSAIGSTASQPNVDSGENSRVRPVLVSVSFVIAVLAGAGCFWAQGFLTTWSPKYLGASLGLNPTQLSIATMLPWIAGALVLFALGYFSRVRMRAGASVRASLVVPSGIVLAVSGAAFLILTGVTGVAIVPLLALAAGFAMIFPLLPTAMGFAIAMKKRSVIMSTLTALASVGGVIAPWMVGRAMGAAGYLAPPPGQPETADGIAALTDGMQTSFLGIGIYLVVLGVLVVLLMNPERNARLAAAQTRSE